jgi:DNA-directed RNA polymerase subunit RPC12/RpoP
MDMIFPREGIRVVFHPTGEVVWKCPKCGAVFTLPMEKEEICCHTAMHKLGCKEFFAGFEKGSIRHITISPHPE